VQRDRRVSTQESGFVALMFMCERSWKLEKLAPYCFLTCCLTV
jgi:hypothetical protein